MSVCNCPTTGLDGIDSKEHKQKVADFLHGLAPDGKLADSDWCLLSITDMARAGNDIQTICESVPFRGGPCARSMRCCGVCSRQCYHRCVQDCLHRLYMWKQLVASTPSTEREKLPLNLRMIVTQKFESHRQLSWVVGEILSRNTNSNLKEYMHNEQIHRNQNPYKIDYAPQVEIDPRTGKRVCDARTGELHILAWPSTGLCPFCLPDVTVDGRVARRRRVEPDYL